MVDVVNVTRRKSMCSRIASALDTSTATTPAGGIMSTSGAQKFRDVSELTDGLKQAHVTEYGDISF